MSKFVRTVVEVIGVAVAIAAVPFTGGTSLLAAGLGVSATTAAAIAVGTEVAVGLFEAATAPKPPGPIANPMAWQSDPQAGIPIIIGRAYFGGKIVYRDTWGGADLPNETIVTVYSIGPVQAVEGLYVNGIATAINGNGTVNIPDYGKMHAYVQRGLQPEAAQIGPLGPPNWTSMSKLSGLAASSITLNYDTKGDNPLTTEPQCGFVIRGVRVYDPRKDSTYPGGSGTQRWNDESTWSYTGYDNPYLVGLTWLIGWRQNGKLVAGVGMPLTGIILDHFVEGANVADANGWKIGGVLDSTDSKWSRLKDILLAGGGEPIRLGAQIGCVVNAPKVSLATIGPNDIVGKARVQATQSMRDRINAVVPRYMAEQSTTTADSNGTLHTSVTWGIVAGSPVVVSDYVTFDGKQRQKQIDYEFVQSLTQSQQLARYAIENSREFGPITLPLGLRWMGYRPGDVVTVNVPEIGLNDQDILLLKRSLEPQSNTVTITARSETAAKHPFALGQTGTAPPTPSVTGPPIIPVPGASAWALTGGTITSENGSASPALFLIGAADSSVIDGIVVEYRISTGSQSDDQDWIAVTMLPPDSTGINISGVQDQTPYQVAVSYRRGSVTGGRLILGPVNAGETSVSWGNVSDPNGTKPEDNATVGAPPGTDIGGRPVEDVLAKLDQAAADIDSLFATYGDTASAAGEAAEAAQAALTAARRAVNALLPSDFQQDGTYFFGGPAQFAGDPATRTPIVADDVFSFPTVAGIGKVIEVHPGAQASIDVSAIGLVKLVAGRTYQITASARALTNIDAPRGLLFGVGLTSSYANGMAAQQQAQSLASGDWVDFALTVDADTMMAAGSGTSVYLRPMFRVEGISDQYQLQYLKIEDVSESRAAAGSAQDALEYSTDAGDYAAAASSAQVSAQLIAGRLHPSTFEDGDLYFSIATTAVGGGNPSAAGWTYPSATAVSPAVNATIGHRVPTRVVPGRVWRLTAVFETAAACNVNMGLYSWDDAGAVQDSNVQGSAAVINSGGAYVSRSILIGAPGVAGCDINLAAGATSFRAHFRVNASDTTAVSATVQSLTIEDYTAGKSAADSATAAATSESNAATASTDAGNSASAASSAATDAQTARGEAQSWAGTSQDYASDAFSSAQDASAAASASLDSSIAARTTVAAALPSDFGQDGTFWVADDQGDPATASPIATGGAYAFVDDGAAGHVLQVSKAAGAGIVENTATRGALRVAAGRVYRCTASIKKVGGTGNQARVGIVGLGADYHYAWWAPTDFAVGTADYAQGVNSLSGDDLLAHGALWIRGAARPSEDAADSLTINIASILLEDTTESVLAAQASSDAYSYAQTAQDHATAASGSADSATYQAGQALIQASAANDSRVLADASAAAAQASQVLAASVGLDSINVNPVFSSWSNAAELPDNWVHWDNSDPDYSRVPGPRGGYAVHMVAAADKNVGIQQSFDSAPVLATAMVAGWYMLSGEIKLLSGTLPGAGFFLSFFDASNNFVEGYGLSAATDPDSSGVVIGNGVVGRTYRFSRLVQAVGASSRKAVLYALANYDGFGTRAAKVIEISKCAFRAATQAEIDSRQAIDDLQGWVATNEGVISNLNGRTAAYWQVSAVAGDGRAELTVLADANGGGAVAITGDVDIRGSVKISGIIRAAAFITDDGYDLRGMVPGTISSATNAQVPGPTLLSLGGGTYSNLYVTPAAQTVANAGSYILLHAEYTKVDNVGSTSWNITLERSTNGGAWTVVEYITQFAAVDVGTYKHDFIDMAHSTGTLQYRLRIEWNAGAGGNWSNCGLLFLRIEAK